VKLFKITLKSSSNSDKISSANNSSGFHHQEVGSITGKLHFLLHLFIHYFTLSQVSPTLYHLVSSFKQHLSHSTSCSWSQESCPCLICAISSPCAIFLVICPMSSSFIIGDNNNPLLALQAYKMWPQVCGTSFRCYWICLKFLKILFLWLALFMPFQWQNISRPAFHI